MKNITLNLFAGAFICTAIISCTKPKQTADGTLLTPVATKFQTFGTGPVFYVAATGGSDSYNGTARTFVSGTTGPFATIQRAVTATTGNPGSTVRIEAGDYMLTGTGNSTVYIDQPGAVGNATTYMADDANNKPKVYAKFASNSWRAVGIETNHIVIDGLEIIGEKTAFPDGSSDAVKNLPKYNTCGIQVGDINSGTLAVYDVVIKNCKIHDFPACGIGCKHASQLTIDHNEVYTNSFYSVLATSGISILVPSNAGVTTAPSPNTADGDSTHPKNFITNNICYNNQCLVAASDGSGIIVDVNSGTTPNLLDGNFRGYTRVENNVCMNNGGAGIATTTAQNVEIDNNTCINNRIVFSTWGEILVNSNSANVLISNNILSAATRGGKAYALIINNGPEKTGYNLLYPNVTENQTITNAVNLSGNATPSQNVLTSNVMFLQTLGTGLYSYTSGNYNYFKISSSSPAVDAGTNGGYIYYSYYDIFNTQRAIGHAGTKPDIGAYEYTY